MCNNIERERKRNESNHVIPEASDYRRRRPRLGLLRRADSAAAVAADT